ITRKRPYIDWANTTDDGVELTEELARDRRTIYLAPETTQDPDLDALLEEFWEEIFEAELNAWDSDRWPTPLTRELFARWFDAEVTESVYDLTPEEPLTHTDVELSDLDAVMHRCGWCEVELEGDAGRLITFELPDRTRLAHRAGLAVPVRIDDKRSVIGAMSPDDSDLARDGQDVLFRACSRQC